MKSRNMITKIALGIAVAALAFSIVTLVRTIVNGSGVFMSCILVVGTAIVVTICAIMLSLTNRYDDYEDDGTDEEDDAPEEDRTIRRPNRRRNARTARRSSEGIRRDQPTVSDYTFPDEDDAAAAEYPVQGAARPAPAGDGGPDDKAVPSEGSDPSGQVEPDPEAEIDRILAEIRSERQ